jgi:GT2 family glycosyltransferase
MEQADAQHPASVCVVIPVRNGAATIARTLESVTSSSVPVAEIIVVDDGSTDDTVVVVEAFMAGVPNGRLLRQPESRGAAAARNSGLAEAASPLVLFTDSDVVLEPDTIARLLDMLGASEAAAAVGVYRERNLAGGWLSHFTTCFSAFTYFRSGDGRPTNFGSQCVLVRRESLQAVGGFDSGLAGATVEDLETGYRLRAAGGETLLAATARMKHDSRFGLGKFWRNYLVKSRVYTRIRLRTSRSQRGAGGYERGSQGLALLLNGLGWLLLAALPFRPALLPLLLLQQVLLLLLWRTFVGHAAAIFGPPGALRLFFIKQVAFAAVGIGALMGIVSAKK